MKTDSSDLMNFSDKQLLERFVQCQDESAFTELISRHGPMVMRVCRQILKSEQDAEDAFQAVFLVLARKSRNVAWQNSIANWLYGVAWRISRRAMQREARRKTRIVEQLGDMTDFSDAKEKSSIEIDAIEQGLYPALYRLAAKHRVPIILCDLEGKSRSDAATELGVTESIIKGRLERGREMLRKALARHGPATLTLLASGLLANRIANAAISQGTVTSLIRTSTKFAIGSTSASVSSSSIVLAKGELLKMLIKFQATMVAILLGIACATSAGVLLFAQTTASPVDKWKQLDASERDMLTKKHLKAIVTAIHGYVDDHKGMLPPAAISNTKLPPEKRLSGFVLLLPYLGAKQIFDQIDLSKAWDDPANAKAAKVIVAEFLSPDEDSFLDSKGFAVSHFAFVRGSKGRDNGMFPLVDQSQLAIPDISDGTSNTLAVGQVHSDFGPWIAAGPSTARFIDPPSEKSQTPGFGSKHKNAAYFSNGDGFTYFWDMSASKPEAIHAIAGRDDRIIIKNNAGLARYDSASEWTKAK